MKCLIIPFTILVGVPLSSFYEGVRGFVSRLHSPATISIRLGDMVFDWLTLLMCVIELYTGKEDTGSKEEQ